MVRKILLYLLVATLCIMLLVAFSYRNPGRIRLLDKIRVPVQSAIMAHFSDYHVDPFNMLNETDSLNNMGLSITDLTPYLENLQPGDILFTNNEKYLSSQFIPGEWKHSLIYLGNISDMETWFDDQSAVWLALQASGLPQHNYLIFDSSVDGVGIRHISRLSNLADQSMMNALAAFRIKRDRQQLKAFITHAFSHIGKNYDYDLLTGNTEALYCSELIYESLKHIGIRLPVSERYVGRDIVSPDGAAHYMLQEGIDKEEFELVFIIRSRDILLDHQSDISNLVDANEPN
jgi:hypothetical protein